MTDPELDVLLAQWASPAAPDPARAARMLHGVRRDRRRRRLARLGALATAACGVLLAGYAALPRPAATPDRPGADLATAVRAGAPSFADSARHLPSAPRLPEFAVAPADAPSSTGLATLPRAAAAGVEPLTGSFLRAYDLFSRELPAAPPRAAERKS